MIEKIKSDNPEFEVSKKNRTKLRLACKDAKILLSAGYETTVTVESLIDGEDWFYDLTRQELESCCSDLFDKFFPPIDKALDIAGYSKDDLDDIILVGGSSRIPIITTRLETYFGKQVNK